MTMHRGRIHYPATICVLFTDGPLVREGSCPRLTEHTPAPAGYCQWHAWAERMTRTHRQVRCHGCGLLAVWVPKERRQRPATPRGR